MNPIEMPHKFGAIGRSQKNEKQDLYINLSHLFKSPGGAGIDNAPKRDRRNPLFRFLHDYILWFPLTRLFIPFQ
jgi:hypothetical protein